MEDTKIFQEIYDKVREVDISKCMESTASSNPPTNPPLPPPQHKRLMESTIGSGNERMDNRQSFYDLLLSKGRDSNISEITLEEWKSFHELYISCGGSYSNKCLLNDIKYSNMDT
jgi:hypothetical protein